MEFFFGGSSVVDLNLINVSPKKVFVNNVPVIFHFHLFIWIASFIVNILSCGIVTSLSIFTSFPGVSVIGSVILSSSMYLLFRCMVYVSLLALKGVPFGFMVNSIFKFSFPFWNFASIIVA